MRRKRKGKRKGTGPIEEMKAFMWVLNNFATVILQKVSSDTGDEIGLQNLPTTAFDFSKVAKGAIPDPEDTDSQDRVVEIYPRGWDDDSWISTRFVRTKLGWRPLRGEIVFPRRSYFLEFEVSEQLEMSPPYAIHEV